MGMIDRVRTFLAPQPQRDMWPFLNFGGNIYPLSLNQTLVGNKEAPEPGYSGLVTWAYKSNPIVFAVMRARMSLFTEARFQWRQVRTGGPGDLFGTPALRILEVPWPNGTTGDLLAHMIQDADLAGNAYICRKGDRLTRLRPDWVTIVMGSYGTEAGPWDVGSEVLGYIYQPLGPGSGQPSVALLTEEVAHFAPIPDPLSPYRGMSWLTPIMREIGADTAMTEHKAAFLTNGATPNMVVSLDPNVTKAAFDAWVETFRGAHEGAANAYRTIYLGAGAKVEVVGKDLQQMDFKTVQGAGETRIAAAGGVPPIIVGLSEGLAAATYSNYGQARRAFSDLTMRTLWRNVCGSLQTIVPPPPMSELWIDDRDIKFLQDDQLDQSTIQSTNAQSIKALLDAGFDPDAAIEAITANDLGRLKGKHSGLFSVQLQPPQPDGPPEPAAPDTATPTAATPDVPIGDRANAVGILIRSGFTAESSREAVGLPPIDHTGLLPITLQSAAKAAATPGVPVPAPEDVPPEDVPPPDEPSPEEDSPADEPTPGGPKE